MDRRKFLKAAGLTAGLFAAGNKGFGKTILEKIQSQGKKPNIIFILADDLGIGDVGCYGADNYKTPNIDNLAKQGVRFTHAYTAPLCGPSRALILTGRYAFRTGAVNQDMTGQMKPSVEIMMPEILKTAGYKTAMIGKWGQLPLTPSDFGFEEYLTFSGSGVYWNTQEKAKKYTVNGTKVELKDNEYMPDLMHNHVVDFITKNRNTPFYLYYSLSHVHAEILRTPDSKPDSKDLYADNISYMDKLIGKLIDELERHKLRDNTLLIFFGDNGTGGKYADKATIGGRRLSGQKGSMLEGGALVPLIIHWPGKTPAGKVTPQLIDSTDFIPTLAEIAGAKLPSKNILDGKSFVSQLKGGNGTERDWVFIELGNQWYVRDQKWKLYGSGKLYDMSGSPFEEKLISEDTKDNEAIEARKRLQAVLDKLNPGGGILDDGDGTGRHADKAKVKGKKKKNQPQSEDDSDQ